jgi:hypothetical protein
LKRKSLYVVVLQASALSLCSGEFRLSKKEKELLKLTKIECKRDVLQRKLLLPANKEIRSLY